MTNCPCGSTRTHDDCCGPLIRGERAAGTAEELMRSRYTAFTEHAIDYIIDTTKPDQVDRVDRESVKQWSERATWKGLEILRTEGGGPDDDEGLVEFIAHYAEQDQDFDHHEEARFARQDGRWYFDFRRSAAPRLKAATKVGRNDPCPCGSGKKFKKCCG